MVEVGLWGSKYPLSFGVTGCLGKTHQNLRSHAMQTLLANREVVHDGHENPLQPLKPWVV